MTTDAIPGLEAGLDLLARLRPYLRSCGNERRGAWHNPQRRLLDYLVVYIADGHGTANVAGRDYRLAPGDLLWIPPDTEHEMRGDPPSMRCPYVHCDLIYRPSHSHWSFHIPGGTTELGELAPLCHPPLADPALHRLTGRIRCWTNARCGELIERICDEAARAQPYAGLAASGMLLELIAEILRGQRAAPGAGGHMPGLEAAADHLTRSCHTAVGIDDAAEIAGLSPSRFRSCFAAHYGCPPRTWLLRARLRRAKHLMLGSDLRLSTIAERCGFANVHNLSRAFRRAEGISPSQWRRYGPPRHLVEGRVVDYPH